LGEEWGSTFGQEWGSTFWSGMGLHFWVRNGAPLLGQEWGSSFCMGIQGMGLHFLYGNSRNGAPLSGHGSSEEWGTAFDMVTLHTGWSVRDHKHFLVQGGPLRAAGRSYRFGPGGLVIYEREV
jgi:hypothetical protein